MVWPVSFNPNCICVASISMQQLLACEYFVRLLSLKMFDKAVSFVDTEIAT